VDFDGAASRVVGCRFVFCVVGFFFVTVLVTFRKIIDANVFPASRRADLARVLRGSPRHPRISSFDCLAKPFHPRISNAPRGAARIFLHRRHRFHWGDVVIDDRDFLLFALPVAPARCSVQRAPNRRRHGIARSGSMVRPGHAA